MVFYQPGLSWLSHQLPHSMRIWVSAQMLPVAYLSPMLNNTCFLCCDQSGAAPSKGEIYEVLDCRVHCLAQIASAPPLLGEEGKEKGSFLLKAE